MPTIQLQRTFRTSDGRIFDSRGDAADHQKRINAAASLAGLLHISLGIENVVCDNIAALIYDNPVLLSDMLPRKRRSKADDTTTQDLPTVAMTATSAMPSTTVHSDPTHRSLPVTTHADSTTTVTFTVGTVDDDNIAF